MENTYYFECITAYDKEAVRHYTIYHYRHVDPRYPAGCIIFGILFLGLTMWQFWEGGGFLRFLFLFCGALLILIGGNLFSGNAGPKVPEGENGQPVVNRQRFFDDRLEYSGQQSQGFYQYSQIGRIGEDAGYFFLYVNSNQALILKKSGMTLGTAEQLRQFLMTKAPGRLK